MNDKLELSPVATILVVIFALVGAAVVILSATETIVDKDLRLTFKSYMEAMVVAIGGLAIGRGLAARRAR